ncbi:Clr5 domain containing protein [Naviculisporaceae sp. PSN 640]
MTKPWKEYEKIITGLYKQQSKPLHEVQRIMEEQYNFKASTRAYRSRFDKWKVYKYSCRKRSNSLGDHSEKTSSNSEDCHSPPSEFSLGSPVMTSINRSPPTMCVESTSPEILGSPITKFEPRQYDRITAPLHPVASLPSPPSLAHDNHPFRFHQQHFEQQYYLSGSHLPSDSATVGYYHRVAGAHDRDHENLYSPVAADQSPGSSPSEHHIRGLSLDGGGGGGGSPTTTQHDYSPQQLHSPTAIGYHSYPVGYIKAPRD